MSLEAISEAVNLVISVFTSVLGLFMTPPLSIIVAVFIIVMVLRGIKSLLIGDKHDH